MTLRFGWIAVLGLCCACASTGPQGAYAPPGHGPQGNAGLVGQGWIGLSHVEVKDFDLDPSVGEVQDVDDVSMPVIGGVVMRRLGGEKLEVGIEGGLSFGWQGNIDALVLGGGGAVVAADTDVMLTDLFAGPYAALRVGDRGRLYFAAGLTLEWAMIDFDFDDTVAGSQHVDEDGFGGGYYARTGFEWEISQGTFVGFGVRFVESSIDPGGQIDDFDLRQVQYLVTLTRSM